MAISLLAALAMKKQSDEASKKADDVRKGSNKSGAGDKAALVAENSMARIQQAIDGLKSKEDPLTPLFDASNQNSALSDAVAKADRKRKLKEQQNAMAMAENPRATGLQSGSKKGSAPAIAKTKRKSKLGSLSL